MIDLRITLSFTRKQKGLAKFPINSKEIIKIAWITLHGNIVNI